MAAGRRGVLITRPEPGASVTAERVAALGYLPVLAPMLVVSSKPSIFPQASRIGAILVTSAAALPGLPTRLNGVTLLAVGDATAEAARRAGFTDVASASGDAAALASLVAVRCKPDGPPLLLASAERQGMPLAADLRGQGFRVIRRTVYRAIPATHLSDDTRAALGNCSVSSALIFSPASGRALVHAMQRDGFSEAARQIEALAISAAAASAIDPLPWRLIRVASQPNQDELLALLT